MCTNDSLCVEALGVAKELPSDPIGNDEPGGNRYQKRNKVFVMIVLADSEQRSGV